MMRQGLVRIVLAVVGLSIPTAEAQVASTQATQLPSIPAQITAPSGGIEINLLRSLAANPATAVYSFSTERRGVKVALRGRVGTKFAHDAAIQTAIALGVPVIDDIVIDTLA